MLVYPFTSILEIMKPSKPDYRKPSHSKKMATIMNSNKYAFEEKIDGISALSIAGRLFSNVISKETGFPAEKTFHVPHISQPLRQLPGKLVLDGELYYPHKKVNHVMKVLGADVDKALERQQNGHLVEPDDNPNLPDFVANNSGQYRPGYIRYVVYDVLRDVEGNWLVNQPYRVRRDYLARLFTDGTLDVPYIDLNRVHYDSFQQRLDEVLDRGGEGGVLKSLDGLYVPGKRPMWNQVKLKQEMEDDVVIMGFEDPTRLYTGNDVANWPFWEDGDPVTEHYYEGLIGSIRIGKFDGNKLVSVGKVTGLTRELREDMTNKPSKYIGTVIKIKAMEESEHGLYRHANFVELHPDKNAEECRLSEND